MYVPRRTLLPNSFPFNCCLNPGPIALFDPAHTTLHTLRRPRSSAAMAPTRKLFINATEASSGPSKICKCGKRNNKVVSFLVGMGYTLPTLVALYIHVRGVRGVWVSSNSRCRSFKPCFYSKLNTRLFVSSCRLTNAAYDPGPCETEGDPVSELANNGRLSALSLCLHVVLEDLHEERIEWRRASTPSCDRPHSSV